MLDRKANRLTADAKQKISLGRGLVRADVAAILFDEPLTVIDPGLKWELRSKLKVLHRALDLTMIYVTHDQTEALTFADTVVVMHEGSVVQTGTPEELFVRPAHTFVGYFIGSPGMNVLPAEVQGRQARIAGHALGLDKGYDALPAGARIEIGIRPEFVAVAAPAPGLLAAEIERIDDLGRSRFARLRVGDLKMAATDAQGPVDRRQRGGPGLRSGADPRLCRFPPRRGNGVMEKIPNQKAWLLVLPVFALVAFSAVIPLMTVVNYSVQDTFGNNKFFWNGIGWYQELLDPSTELGGRFFASLWRNLAFSAIVLAIEMPLGIVVALAMPREGWGVAFSLVVLALPLLIPWNVVGTIWQIFGRTDIGLLGYTLNWLGFDYNYVAYPLDAWLTIIVMDVWHWTSLVALLCYAGLKSIPEAFYQAASDRRRVALGGVPGHPAAQDEARAADRRPAALHGLVHDLHRAVRRHRRRPRQFDDLPVDRAGQAGARPVRPRQGRGDVDRLHADHPHRVLGVLHRHDQCRRGPALRGGGP